MDMPKTNKPITLFFHDGTVMLNCTDEDAVEITPEETVRTTNSLGAGEWAELQAHFTFRHWFKKIYGIGMPESNKVAPLAAKHVAGLILLTLKAIRHGKKPLLRFPETYLHPKQQVELADFIIELSR
jgi:hypothetical protein